MSAGRRINRPLAEEVLGRLDHIESLIAGLAFLKCNSKLQRFALPLDELLGQPVAEHAHTHKHRWDVDAPVFLPTVAAHLGPAQQNDTSQSGAEHHQALSGNQCMRERISVATRSGLRTD